MLLAASVMDLLLETAGGKIVAAFRLKHGLRNDLKLQIHHRNGRTPL